MAIMLRRDIKLYTTAEPPTVDPSVAPPKIFAKYALQKKRRYPLNLIASLAPVATLLGDLIVD
jgi:hypothetical protein